MTTEATIKPSVRPVPKVGSHIGTRFSDYARWDAVNWHSLKPFRKSAKAGHRALTEPDESTDALEMGDLFHTTTLEPHRLETEYAVMPEFSGHHNSKAYKEAVAEWDAAHAGMATPTRYEMSLALRMRDAILAHPLAGKILQSPGKNEVGIAWRDKRTGQLCKGRCDAIRRIKMGWLDLDSPTPDADTIALVDLKKTSDHAKRPNDRIEDYWPYTSDRYGYHGQMAFYHDGLVTLNPTPIIPIIIAVEEEGDFDVGVFDYRPMIEAGRSLYELCVDRLITGIKTSKWPGGNDQLIPHYPFKSQEPNKFEQRKDGL